MTQQQQATPQQEFEALGNQIDKINLELSQLEERAEDLIDAKQQAIGIRNYLHVQAQASADQEANVAAATAPIYAPEDEDEDEDTDFAPNAGPFSED